MLKSIFSLLLAALLLLPGCVGIADEPPELAELRALRAEHEETIARLQAELQAAQAAVAEQAARLAELEAFRDSTRAVIFDHSGLFYDPEHIELVRSRRDKEPWRSSLQRLESIATGYLDLSPQPVQGSWYVPSPYDDPAANHAIVEPLEESTTAMIALAQHYLFTGEASYAQKAVEIAGAWTGALMELENMQAVWEAGWEMLAMALAAGMLHDYPGWDRDDRRAFEDWLNERTWHIIARNDQTNNHQYWIAAQAAATGVLTEDSGLFDWAMTLYRRAISFDVMPDGHLQQETERGDRGMFYQNFALEPLALTAEIARRQGVDLWGFAYEGKDIKLAIDYLFGYFHRPEDWPWSDQPQDMTFIDPGQGGRKVGWFELAYYRYRDSDIKEYLLEQRPIFSRRVGGLTTLTHGLE